MEIQLIKKGTETYFETVVSAEAIRKDGHDYNQIRMLEENDIEYLVKPSRFTIDDRVKLRFGSPGKSLLVQYINKNKINEKLLKQIILQIYKCAEVLDKYLLDIDNLVLDIDYIFFDVSRMEIFFLYIPGFGCSFKIQLKRLMEKIMLSFDHRDYDGIEYMYDVYETICKDNFYIKMLSEFSKDSSQIINQDLYINKKLENVKKLENMKDIENVVSNQKTNHTEDYKNKLNLNIKEYNDEDFAEKNERGRGGLVRFLLLLGGGVSLVVFSVLYFCVDRKNIYAYACIGSLVVMAGMLLFSNSEDEIDPDESMREYRDKENSLEEIESKSLKAEKKKRKFRNENDKNMKSVSDNKIASDNYGLFGNVTYKKNEYAYDGAWNENDTHILREEEKNITGLIPLSNAALDELSLNDYSHEIVVGRKTGNKGYSIDNSQISRCHAKIYYKSGDFYVCDNNSTNGTFVNSVRLNSCCGEKLKVGDIVRFANEDFLVS